MLLRMVGNFLKQCKITAKACDLCKGRHAFAAIFPPSRCCKSAAKAWHPQPVPFVETDIATLFTPRFTGLWQYRPDMLGELPEMVSAVLLGKLMAVGERGTAQLHGPRQLPVGFWKLPGQVQCPAKHMGHEGRLRKH